MKIIIFLFAILGLSFTIHTISLQKVQKQPFSSKAIQNYIDSNMKNELRYLMKTFLPKIDSQIPELVLSQTDQGIYVGTVQIGTPAQDFKVQIDTGSQFFWVASSKCYTFACKFKNKYDANKSTTFEQDGTHFSFNYGNGPLKGVWGKDTVNIAGKQISNVNFVQMEFIKGEFFDIYELDGMVGLGLQPNPVGLTLFQQGQKENVWQDNSFSIYFTKGFQQEGSSLILGGFDSKYQQSDFKYYPNALSYQWNVKFDRISIGRRNFPIDSAYLTTGTQLIFAPTEIAQGMRQQVGLQPNATIVSCDFKNKLPSIKLKINGDILEIPSERYIFEWNFGRDQCVFGIQGYQPQYPGDKNAIILGEIFFQQYYTHFDIGNQRVGFSLAK